MGVSAPQDEIPTRPSVLKHSRPVRTRDKIALSLPHKILASKSIQRLWFRRRNSSNAIQRQSRGAHLSQGFSLPFGLGTTSGRAFTHLPKPSLTNLHSHPCSYETVPYERMRGLSWERSFPLRLQSAFMRISAASTHAKGSSHSVREARMEHGGRHTDGTRTEACALLAAKRAGREQYFCPRWATKPCPRDQTFVKIEMIKR